MRCKHCRTKFEPKRFLQKFCEETEECKDAAIEFALAQVKKEKKIDWNKRKAKIKKSLKRKQDYEKELETIVNEYVRLRDQDKPCISCGAHPGTFTITAGHYYPAGTYKNIRYDLININGQCWWNCNKNKSGNLIEYRKGLVKRYGEEAVIDLDKRSLKSPKFTVPDLIEMKKTFKLKIKNKDYEKE